MFRPALFLFAIALCAAPAVAQTESKQVISGSAPKATPKVGPGAGGGQRHADRPKAKPTTTQPVTKKAATSKTAKPGTAKPKTTETSDKKSSDDPELKALHDAESVLFPKPLPGSTAGFSWDVPKTTTKTEVVASGLPPVSASDPGLDDTDEVATDAEWIRSLTLPDLPVRLESRVIRYLKFYRDNTQGKAIARAWAKKSGRYVPALKAELSKAGLPTDLVWLSLIESGHNPTIVSHAGAAGLWQFMPESGRVYGLSVDRWTDERLDPKRATEAAVLYLSDLHRRFGTWELAMAAYNMGYGGLSKAIRKFNTNDYWELCRYEAGIPWETTLYVPKIFAIAVVMTNRKAFGLDDVSPDSAESFESVVVAAGTPLERIAAAAEVPISAIEGLNPQLLAGRTPPPKPGAAPKSYVVRVPKGNARAATERLAKSDLDADLEPYVVRAGDSVSTIATARGSQEGSIKQTNRLTDKEALEPGTVLLVPKKAGKSNDTPEDGVVVVSPREFKYPDRERVFYRVRGGDTLGRIATALGTTRSDLVSWNALDPNARLQAGMTLQVWVKPGDDLSSVRVLRESQAQLLVAGTPEFFDHFEGLNGRKRIVVEAKAGDTLASLGKRYGMSIGWMERINRRSRKKALADGEKLVVYVAQNAPVNSVATEPDPLPELESSEPPSTPNQPSSIVSDKTNKAGG